MDELLEILTTDGTMTLIGVMLGAFLGFGVRWIETKWQSKKNKDSIREELVAIKFEIPQKRDILMKMISDLNSDKVLSGKCVKFMRLAYTQYMPKVLVSLTTASRNCLHNIHERANNIEHIMDDYERSIVHAMSGDYMNDPIGYHKGLLADMIDSLTVMEKLIDSYVSGKPIDPLYSKEGGFDAIKSQVNQ